MDWFLYHRDLCHERVKTSHKEIHEQGQQKKNARSIHVTPVYRFYNPWNRHKTRDFVTFSVGMEMEHRYKMD